MQICISYAVLHSHFLGHTRAVSALCQRRGTNHLKDTQCLNAACMAPVSSHTVPLPKREGSITSLLLQLHIFIMKGFQSILKPFSCGNRKQDFISATWDYKEK